MDLLCDSVQPSWKEEGQELTVTQFVRRKEPCATVLVPRCGPRPSPLCLFSPVPPQPKCDGQLLLTRVWRRLNLIECDYFGLEFQNVPSYWVGASPSFGNRL